MPVIKTTLQCDKCGKRFTIDGETDYIGEVNCSECLHKQHQEHLKTLVDMNFTVKIKGAGNHIPDMLKRDLKDFFEHLQECEWFREFEITYNDEEAHNV